MFCARIYIFQNIQEERHRLIKIKFNIILNFDFCKNTNLTELSISVRTRITWGQIGFDAISFL